MLSQVVRAFRIEIRRRLGRSSPDQWADPSSLVSEWDARTVRVAAMIRAGTTVLEFGAGRMVLRDHLPEGCTYIPSDFVDRGPGTIICDLNAELPQFPEHDVAVLVGTLEYVNEVPALLAHLHSPEIVGSYTVPAPGEWTIKRRRFGWVNDYSWSELQELFASLGYTLAEDGAHNSRGRDEPQRLFRFARE